MIAKFELHERTIVITCEDQYLVEFDVYSGIDADDLEFSGSIKWDGCANVDFCIGGLYHFCGPNSVDVLQQVMLACYKYAEEHFKQDCESRGQIFDDKLFKR